MLKRLLPPYVCNENSLGLLPISLAKAQRTAKDAKRSNNALRPLRFFAVFARTIAGKSPAAALLAKEISPQGKNGGGCRDETAYTT